MTQDTTLHCFCHVVQNHNLDYTAQSSSPTLPYYQHFPYNTQSLFHETRQYRHSTPLKPLFGPGEAFDNISFISKSPDGTVKHTKGLRGKWRIDGKK